jgi:peptidyl-prolyl cis-trans isomerase D
MDPAFDQMAFSLDEGVLSQPVRSQFGYHLVQVTEIEPGEVKGFEEVRDQLAAEAARRGAEGAFFDWAERLANLAYEHPDTLEPAAEALGLELSTSDWIDRKGGEGILANSKIVGAAFSDEVLREGLNSELIEPERDVLQAVVVRVLEHEEASVKPLDQVREEIVASLRDERAAEMAKAAADEMVDRIESGAELAAVAGAYEVSEAGLIGRDASDVPPGVRDLAFDLPRPGETGVSVGSQALANGNAAVVVVSRVNDGSPAELAETEKEQERLRLRQAIARTHYDELLDDLQSRSKIERKTFDEAAAE